MWIRNSVLGLLLAVGILAFAGPAHAETLEVPQEFNSIQAAVDAASPGDVVAVKGRKAPYDENVQVTTNNLQIKGVDGRPVVDAHEIAQTNLPAFDVIANEVAIRNVEIHHGGGINCVGADCAFSKLRFRGKNSDDCVSITGIRGIVTSSVLAGCDQNAVDIQGDDGVIRSNKADLIDSDCFAVTGEGLTFEDNSSKRCEDGTGLRLDGDDALVRGSTVRNTDNESFRLEGDDLRVKNNRATETDSDCFQIDGDDALFTGNSADVCDYGLELNGNQARATKNQISHGDQTCLRINGNDAVAHKNEINACYRGMDISGQDPVVTENTIDRIFVDDGITVNCNFPFFEGEPEPLPEDIADCNDTFIASNLIKQSGDDDQGISVFTDEESGGLEIRDNVARGGLGEGLRLSVSDSLVVGNRASDNGSEEEAGIDIFGSGNTIARNVSNANGGEGLLVIGNQNELRQNRASENFQDGIRVEGNANALIENETGRNLAEGIEIRGFAAEPPDNPGAGLDTVAIDNISAGNEQVDCAADPAVTFVQREGNVCADGSDFDEPGSGIGPR